MVKKFVPKALVTMSAHTGFLRMEAQNEIDTLLSPVFELSTQSLHSIEAPQIKVGPIPTNGELHVWLPPHREQGYLSIVDINGKRVLHRHDDPSIEPQVSKLDLSDLPKGIYSLLWEVDL